MTDAAKPAAKTPDPLEEEVDEAIRVCGGDPRLAVRGLILGQRQIERDVSAGYVRKGHR